MLLISVESDVDVVVGALGTIAFTEGFYAYVGSAQNGLEKRISRHLSSEKKKLWHIDYLLSGGGKVVGVYYKEADKSEECRIAKVLAERGSGVLGFGCSDCLCGSHLFKVDGAEDFDGLGVKKYPIY